MILVISVILLWAELASIQLTILTIQCRSFWTIRAGLRCFCDKKWDLHRLYRNNCNYLHGKYIHVHTLICTYNIMSDGEMLQNLLSFFLSSRWADNSMYFFKVLKGRDTYFWSNTFKVTLLKKFYLQIIQTNIHFLFIFRFSEKENPHLDRQKKNKKGSISLTSHWKKTAVGWTLRSRQAANCRLSTFPAPIWFLLTRPSNHKFLHPSWQEISRWHHCELSVVQQTNNPISERENFKPRAAVWLMENNKKSSSMSLTKKHAKCLLLLSLAIIVF